MPLRKIKDWTSDVCLSPEHNPPAFYVYEPGEYEYECPACHKKVRFVVQGVIS